MENEEYVFGVQMVVAYFDNYECEYKTFSYDFLPTKEVGLNIVLNFLSSNFDIRSVVFQEKAYLID